MDPQKLQIFLDSSPEKYILFFPSIFCDLVQAFIGFFHPSKYLSSLQYKSNMSQFKAYFPLSSNTKFFWFFTPSNTVPPQSILKPTPCAMVSTCFIQLFTAHYCSPCSTGTQIEGSTKVNNMYWSNLSFVCHLWVLHLEFGFHPQGF